MELALKKTKYESGFTLVELLVAMAIFSVVIMAAIGIFLKSLGGSERVFAQQAVQESGRFMLESISKEIRMSKVIQMNGVDYASLPEDTSGPYSSLRVLTAKGETVDYQFSGANFTRGGSALNPVKVAVKGGFYLKKHSTAQARVMVVMNLKSTNQNVAAQTEINLQTSVTSREYAP